MKLNHIHDAFELQKPQFTTYHLWGYVSVPWAVTCRSWSDCSCWRECRRWSGPRRRWPADASRGWPSPLCCPGKQEQDARVRKAIVSICLSKAARRWGRSPFGAHQAQQRPMCRVDSTLASRREMLTLKYFRNSGVLGTYTERRIANPMLVWTENWNHARNPPFSVRSLHVLRKAFVAAAAACERRASPWRPIGGHRTMRNYAGHGRRPAIRCLMCLIGLAHLENQCPYRKPVGIETKHAFPRAAVLAKWVLAMMSL